MATYGAIAELYGADDPVLSGESDLYRGCCSVPVVESLPQESRSFYPKILTFSPWTLHWVNIYEGTKLLYFACLIK